MAPRWSLEAHFELSLGLVAKWLPGGLWNQESWSFGLKEPKAVELLTRRAQCHGAFDLKSPKLWSFGLKEPKAGKLLT